MIINLLRLQLPIYDELRRQWVLNDRTFGKLARTIIGIVLGRHCNRRHLDEFKLLTIDDILAC